MSMKISKQQNEETISIAKKEKKKKKTKNPEILQANFYFSI